MPGARLRERLKEFRRTLRLPASRLLAFHDIAENQALETNQVQRFWRTIRDRYPSQEFVADRGQCGFGIGVIRAPQRAEPSVRPGGPEQRKSPGRRRAT